MKINKSTLSSLIELNSSEKRSLDLIYDALSDFESYHKAVFDSECMKMIYLHIEDRETYIDKISTADKSRTNAHNALLARVSILNRMAEKNQLPPFYDGIISEDQPYRREVASAVFEWMQSIIENRA